MILGEILYAAAGAHFALFGPFEQLICGIEAKTPRFG